MFIIKDTRKKVKRKDVTFKTWPKRVLGKRKVEKQDKGRGSASVSVQQLEDQNKQLADALNKIKSQNTILQNQIRDTRAKHLDLRVENATQRDEIRRLKDGSDVSIIQKQVEQSMQQKLQTYLEPMQKSLHQALAHTEGLATSLTQTMQFSSALDRKSKSIQSSPVTTQQTRASPTKQPTADSSSDITVPAYKKPTSSVAQILPMVKGHPISQPKIKMSRVLMNTEEIESLQRQHPSRLEESEDDEEGPSVTNSEEDDEEEVTSRQQHQRQLRLRNLKNRPLADLSDLVEEEEEEEEEEDSDEGERRVTPRLVLDTVLIPRLVLDRVAVPENPVRSPHKRRRSSPVKREILQQRRRKRSRASIERFEASSDVMSPRVMIRDDAHELMSKINNSSCDDTEPANLTNPYSDWSLPSTPDESGVDVTLDEEEAESTSSASTGSSKTEEAKPTGQQQQKAAAPLTPGGSRETQTQFLERVMSEDPREGPSWLYDDNNKKRRAPPKSKKTKTNSSEKSSQNVSEEPRTTAIQTSSSSEKSSRPVSDEPHTISIQASGSSSSSELPARPSDEDESRRGRRRAAAAAVGSLKEPSANKKLRQGDQNSSSIYTDFVPGTKAHSGTSNRRTTSMGGSQPAVKRQSLHKKRSK